MKFALEQVNSLIQDISRPLIITDADEVILHFAGMLSEYLRSQGMYVNFISYALEGNIKYIDSDKPVSRHLFKEIIAGYFENYVDKQPLVKNAAAHLENLSEICDIVILTNIPHNFADRRRKLFADSGLNYPMISSSGPKGPVLRAISEKTSREIIFIDDIAQHHTSAANHVPDSLRIQYIANDHLNSIEAKAKDCHHRCDDWFHIEQVVTDYLKQKE